jgi:hypothetical protein
MVIVKSRGASARLDPPLSPGDVGGGCRVGAEVHLCSGCEQVPRPTIFAIQADDRFRLAGGPAPATLTVSSA